MNLIIENTRALLKLIKFSLIISVYMISALIKYCLIQDPIKRRRSLIQNTQFFSQLMLKAYNIKLICKNPIEANENSLVIGNHMGFIDIVCLQTIQASAFITSTEMKSTPVLGQIAILGAVVFVNRNNRSNIQDELKDIILVLKQGFRVVLYAEARASNGEQVLPFKKTLMTAAAFADVPIRPYIFNYRKINNREIKFSDRDSLCWYDDNGFVSAIWKSLKIKQLECEIEFLPLVKTKPEDDRTVVSEKIHLMISEKFIPFNPPF